MKQLAVALLLFSIFKYACSSEPIIEIIKWEDMFPEAAAAYPGLPAITSYWSGMWEPQASYGDFKLGHWHKDSFNISWGVHSSEPDLGYIYHYGYVWGINDTIKLRVYFDNRSAESFAIGSHNPQDWFYPVLYDPYVDVFKTNPLADTSAFSYRFEHWITMRDGVISEKPDSIYNYSSKSYGMILSLWDIPPGHFRVILKPTALKPQDVNLTLSSAYNLFKIVRPQSVLDTMNAYSKIAEEALSRDELTLMETYVNNILNRNPFSIPGWYLKYHWALASGDSTYALTAVDSAIYLIENWLDPFFPDSTSITKYHGYWLGDSKAILKYLRWRLLFPEAARGIVHL